MKKLFGLAILAISILQFSAVSKADDAAANFRKNHPRRAQVNRRERRQQGRIANGVKSGKLSPQETQQLEQQEVAIKQQERADVKANGGYLTKKQQRQLNKEENQTSKEIYQDKHN